MTVSNQKTSAFRPVPYMGVIWVVHQAEKLGFYNGHPDWCNLGQGQPEVGPNGGCTSQVFDDPPRTPGPRLGSGGCLGRGIRR